MKRPIEPPPSLPAIAALAFTTAIAILPHLPLLPIWFVIMLGGCATWRLMASASRVRPPSAALRLFLTVVVTGLVFWHYGTLLGREGGTALLATMLSLKLLETWRYRDVFLASILVYFLALSAFLGSQSLWMLPYLLAVVSGSTISLLLLSGRRFRRFSIQPLIFTAKLIGLSLLPAILLLYLFPRLASPLWGLPEFDEARTGLSDEMSPGSFSDLIIDDRPAMRVRFDDGIRLPQANLYWRGPVMWDYDGQTWRGVEREHLQRLEMPLLVPLGEPIGYEVILLPTDRHFRFFLEMPVDLPSDVALLPDFQTVTREQITSTTIYRGNAVVDYQLGGGALDPRSRARALRLPPDFNPQSIELAQQWRAQFDDDLALVNYSLSHFRQQPFSYTLNPPLLGRHAMDEFLFETRAGFCEHYASAFVVLMRAARIPARVVTGYQGGDYTGSDDYLLVRNSNAHAWAEVWLEDRGWVRVDPTAAVAPERIESGIMSTTAAPSGWRHTSWVRDLRQAWDGFQDRWDRWLVSYDDDDQQALLERMNLAEHGIQALVGILFVTLALLFGTFAWWLLSKSTAMADPLYKGYVKLLSKLRKAGLHGRDSDTPADWVARLEHCEPAQHEVVALLKHYQRLRYQPQGGDGEVPGWLQQVNKLRLERIVSRTDQSNSRQGK